MFELLLVLLREQPDKEGDLGVIRQTMPAHFFIAFQLLVQGVDGGGQLGHVVAGLF